ncbi:MAG: signal peptide peptidase SppA [Halobacteriovoraceae bacterium]|nr:signal peptide peptidase SppA [Halobacteriovoraceae bacterium]MBT5095633.1 signal peptide peptidase SppA [Halobacteriovoraceae bacterium]
MSTNRNRALYGILLLVFLFFIILMVFAAYTVNIFKNKPMGLGGLDVTPTIAVIEVEGVIMSSKTTVELLQIAEKDKETKAIIMRVNSPGGAVGPCQEIYEEMRRIDSAYDPKKKTGKPVYASFGSVAASGGYYIGAAARKIYANAGTVTGSIGVIMQFMNLSRLYEWAMVRPETIKAGRYKDIGSPSRNMNEEERGIMEGMIAGVHRQFIRDIVANRKKKIKGDIVELAQGQIFSGEEALQFGLVDELKGLYAAGRSIHKELDLKGEFGIKYIKKKKKVNFLEVLSNLDSKLEKFNWKTLAGMQKAPILMFK